MFSSGKFYAYKALNTTAANTHCGGHDNMQDFYDWDLSDWGRQLLPSETHHSTEEKPSLLQTAPHQ